MTDKAVKTANISLWKLPSTYSDKIKIPNLCCVASRKVLDILGYDFMILGPVQ